MKKLILVLLLTVGLMADNGDPYIGVGSSFSNADDTKVECRASLTLLSGVKFHSKLFDISLEGRKVSGFAGDYTSESILPKATIQSLLRACRLW